MGTFLRKHVLIAVIISVVIIGFISVILSIRVKPVPLPEKPAVVSAPVPKYEIIGTSLEGRKIEAYTYSGKRSSVQPSSVSGNPQINAEDASKGKHIVFVGGMHGGYEWNSVLLAYEFMDYLEKNPKIIPGGLSVTVIPSLNPDGVYKVIEKEGRFLASDATTSEKVLESGRFNARKVDLNRNFDCNWQAKNTWKTKQVSGGSKAFSEPEAEALRKFALGKKPDAFIFWHSQANAVYASECNDGILPVTLDIMNVYAKASGYPAIKSFDSYKVNGDSEGWLASEKIPAITVELKTHKTIEWDKNLAGIKALFEYFTKK